MQPQNRVSDYKDQAVEALHQVPQWASETVEEQPITAVLGAFSLGMLIGAGFVMAMAPPRRHTRLEEAENLAHRISHAIHNAIPKQVSDLWHR